MEDSKVMNINALGALQKKWHFLSYPNFRIDTGNALCLTDQISRIKCSVTILLHISYYTNSLGSLQEIYCPVDEIFNMIYSLNYSDVHSLLYSQFRICRCTTLVF